jgi:hypothetical protein
MDVMLIMTGTYAAGLMLLAVAFNALADYS